MGSLFSNIFKDNKNFLIFVIGLLSLVKIRLLGTFGIGELVIFAIFPLIDRSDEKKIERKRTFFNTLLHL